MYVVLLYVIQKSSFRRKYGNGTKSTLTSEIRSYYAYQINSQSIFNMAHTPARPICWIKFFFLFFHLKLQISRNFLVKCQRGREVKWHEIFISSYYASMSNVDDFGPNIFLLGICRKNQIYRYEKTSSL